MSVLIKKMYDERLEFVQSISGLADHVFRHELKNLFRELFSICKDDKDTEASIKLFIDISKIRDPFCQSKNYDSIRIRLKDICTRTLLKKYTRPDCLFFEDPHELTSVLNEFNMFFEDYYLSSLFE